MRTLFILRGAPGSGKSTWIKENELDSYTISTDGLRLMYQSPITTATGERAISQNHDKEVWDMVLNLMERRMENGEMILVDATHYKAPLINKYKDLITKYRYRVFVVDFSNVPEEELIERNKHRGFRNVPAEVISKMCVALKDNTEVKKSYKIITPEEAIEMINSPLVPFDANEYEKIIIFGDIHGCYEPLQTYFQNNPFNERYNYIFCGDYLDRGTQNKEVLEFLISLRDKKNVVFLEGNHEKWLRIYADKHYDMEYYENRPINYKDPFVTKLIAQLKDRQTTIQKQINRNKNKSEELSKLLRESWETNPDNREVYYEFELINVPETQKQLHQENGIHEVSLEKIKRAIHMLQHEECSTQRAVEDIQEFFQDRFNTNLSMDINNILEKSFNVTSNRKDNPIKSLEFIKRTYPQIKDIDKTEIRRFCDRLSQMSYFTYGNSVYLVTHGGLPCLPTLKTQTIEMIKGVGKYEDHDAIDKMFADNEDNDEKIFVHSIHGHRNTMKCDTSYLYGEHTLFNLEGQIEYGGDLRILELEKDANNNVVTVPIEYHNNGYVEPEEEVIEEKTDLELLKEMYHSKWIQVKNLNDNIISLNFTRDAFEKGKWNNLTNQARGLFVDKTNGNIVARSYEKFFNYKEQPCTEPAYMKENIQWPLKGYRKENGYLGIISKHNGKVRFFTKSTDGGDFVNWFIGILCGWYDISTEAGSYTELYNEWCNINFDVCYAYKDSLKDMKDQLADKLNTLLEDNYSYIFEIVDINNDPHIIKYKENRITLLDVFKNQMKEEHVDWHTLNKIANVLCVPCKSLELTFHNWEEFEDWKNKFHSGITQWDCKHEGYVFEDAAGYRVKFKSSFYKFWKQMRSLKERIQGGRNNAKIYKTKEEIQVVKLLENIDRQELKKMSIIDIQDRFYEEYGDC